VCAFIVIELLRITRQIHCKAVEQRVTLIHGQYNQDWGTSYCRPPIDPYLTSPCYKILAAPLAYALAEFLFIEILAGDVSFVDLFRSILPVVPTECDVLIVRRQHNDKEWKFKEQRAKMWENIAGAIRYSRPRGFNIAGASAPVAPRRSDASVGVRKDDSQAGRGRLAT